MSCAELHVKKGFSNKNMSIAYVEYGKEEKNINLEKKDHFVDEIWKLCSYLLWLFWQTILTLSVPIVESAFVVSLPFYSSFKADSLREAHRTQIDCDISFLQFHFMYDLTFVSFFLPLTSRPSKTGRAQRGGKCFHVSIFMFICQLHFTKASSFHLQKSSSTSCALLLFFSPPLYPVGSPEMYLCPHLSKVFG